MNYFMTEPDSDLKDIVQNFWMIESDSSEQVIQKIVPDGYPELIFHYGDSYECNFGLGWNLQSGSLIAGQIRNFFHLRNTGRSAMFAIKFQPWALKMLFNISMYELVDSVIPAENTEPLIFNELRKTALNSNSFEDRVKEVSEWLRAYRSSNTMSYHKPLVGIVKEIINTNGAIPIHKLLDEYGIGERTLERNFKTYIGLPPKFYSRVIRLSYIFSLVENDEADWMDISFAAGFYDQSHFIKDFKEFTGDEPTKYPFLEKNMANFFLKS